MDTWVWVVIVIAAVVIVALATAMFMGRRRTERLQGRFGPEYDRTVEEADGRRAAERELTEREKRRADQDVPRHSHACRLVGDGGEAVKNVSGARHWTSASCRMRGAVTLCRCEPFGAPLEAEQHAPRHEKRRGLDHPHEQPGPESPWNADEIARDESGPSFIERIQAELPDPGETVARAAQDERPVRLDACD